MDLSNFTVHNCPETLTYIPNFITSEEEQQILKNVENAPKPKWTQLLHRRLINYGGIPHVKGMIAEEIPSWLQIFTEKINNLGIFESHKANHVLVNEYLPGQGIMPHTDGPLFYPTISTISCGSHTVLEFYKPNNEKSPTYEELSVSQNEPPIYQRELCCKLLIEPRSLLIVKDSMYHDYLHSISEITEDMICDYLCNLSNCENVYKLGDRIPRSKRISLTIRHVPKTTKLKLKLGP